MFAIIRTGGKQYRVREGDRLSVERLDGDEGSEITLSDVLLVENDEGETTVGAPLVAGAEVTAQIVEHSRDKKVFAFRYKNKTRQRTLRGHRQHKTQLAITAIKA